MGSQRDCTWILGLAGFRVERIDDETAESTIYAVDTPPYGGDTMFARQYAISILEDSRSGNETCPFGGLSPADIDAALAEISA